MTGYLLILAAAVGMAAGAALAWLLLRGQQAALVASAAAGARHTAEAEQTKLREELIRREGSETAVVQKNVELAAAVEQATAERKAAEAQLAAEKELHGAAAGEIKRLTAQLQGEQQNLALAREELATARQQFTEQTGSHQAVERELAELRTSLTERERSLQQQAKLLEDAQVKLKDAFAAVAQEQLSQSNTSFLKLAQAQLAEYQQLAKAELDKKTQAMDTLVKPINDQLGKLAEHVQHSEKASAQTYGSISAELKALHEAQQQLRSKADELTDALRGQPTRWGRWGELQLRNLVEMSGMVSFCDFCEQETIAGAEGAKLRPDMLIKLAGGRHIAVDSKAPVELYLAAMEQPTEDERQAKLREYAAGVRRHVADLARKSYWEHVAGSPEFVVMFMPGESFFSAVHIADPSLIEPNADTRVILASPTTLLALLRAVSYGWKQVQLADNARQISDAGAELVKRLRTFTEHLQKVGNGLTSAIGGYNAAVGSLEGRILPQARKMQELGAGDAKLLPEVALLEVQPRQLAPPELFAEVAGQA
jgi:DNA recombination protein RmuC